MLMAEKVLRKPISKSTRFRIFARDGFVCRYCGEQPPEVKLVIDHIKPVIEGGTNDDANLISACQACNGGKGRKPLPAHAPTDADERRMAQEYAEQRELSNAATAAAEAREHTKQTIINYFCNTLGVNEMPRRTVSRLYNLIVENGSEEVFDWIEIAASAVGPEDLVGVIKYINGIARKRRNEDELCDECGEKEAEFTVCAYCGEADGIGRLCKACADDYHHTTKGCQVVGCKADDDIHDQCLNCASARIATVCLDCGSRLRFPMCKEHREEHKRERDEYWRKRTDSIAEAQK